MTTAEKILRKKKVYKAEMNKIMPVEQSDVLWQKAAGKLDSIIKHYGSLPKGVKMHTDKIFPAAAIYLTAKDAVGGEKAYHIIENTAVLGCADIEKKLQKLMKVPGMRSLFVAVWDPMTKKLFGLNSGFQNRFYPRKKGEYRMDIVACPYNRYFTELGCPELTRIFCENDERTYGNLPGLQFVRTGTLGKGADFFGIGEIHGQLIRCGTCGNSDKCDYLIVGSKNKMAAEFETITDEQGFLVSRRMG